MGNLIECGERTVQTKDRICIHDITKKYDIKPGDSVIVDIRLPANSEFLGEELANRCNSTKSQIMSMVLSLEFCSNLLEDCEAVNVSNEDRKDLIARALRLIGLETSVILHSSGISDKEYSKFKNGWNKHVSDE